jgi:hypothetical protein
MDSSVRIGRGAQLTPGTAFALRLATPLAAALLAALAAHVAIDVVGDYVLVHDTYDDHAHGSRWLASLALAAAALAALWTLARAVLAETRGSRGALRSALSAALPASPRAFVLTVVAVALPLLPAMAWLDALAAGAGVDDAADLFGGSIPLGAGIALACALASAAGARRLVAFLGCHHRAIVRVVEAFVRVANGGTRAVLGHGRERPNRSRVPAALARCTSGNRAPPALPGLTPQA